MWWSCLPKIEECGPRPLPLWTSDWTRGPLRVFRQTNYYKLTFKVQRAANEYAAKRGIYKRPDQQKYTLSRHTEFCKADRATAVDSCLAKPLSNVTTPLCFWFFRCRVDVLQS